MASPARASQDHRRNELVATDLMVTTVTAGFAFVAMIAGIYGMVRDAERGRRRRPRAGHSPQGGPKVPPRLPTLLWRSPAACRTCTLTPPQLDICWA